MSYTRNFGFRDLSNIVRDGRNAVPTGLTGSDVNGFLIGTAVTVDPANPGMLKRPGASAAPTALSGIVIYEHIQFQGVDPFLTTQYDAPFIYAPQGRYAQMVHGLGTKVWFKNTGDIPLYDGRTQPGSTLITSPVAALNVGDGLAPDANGTWASTTSSEVQTVTITGAPTGGTFTLTFGGQTTAGIAFNAAASAVQSALQALSSVGSGNVSVSGSGPYTVSFTGSLSDQNEAALTANAASLTGGTTPAVTVATTTQGGTVSAANAWLVVESVNSTTGLVEARFTF